MEVALDNIRRGQELSTSAWIQREQSEVLQVAGQRLWKSITRLPTSINLRQPFEERLERLELLFVGRISSLHIKQQRPLHYGFPM